MHLFLKNHTYLVQMSVLQYMGSSLAARLSIDELSRKMCRPFMLVNHSLVHVLRKRKVIIGRNGLLFSTLSSALLDIVVTSQ